MASKYGEAGDGLVIRIYQTSGDAVKRLELATAPVEPPSDSSGSPSTCACHQSWLFEADEINPAEASFRSRSRNHVVNGEECHSLDLKSIELPPDSKRFKWINPPPVYAESVARPRESSMSKSKDKKGGGFFSKAKRNMNALASRLPVPTTIFEHVFGDANSAALFKKRKPPGVSFRLIAPTEMEPKAEITMDEIMNLIASDIVDQDRLLDYLCFDGGTLTPGDDREADCRKVNDSLCALATSSRIYYNMPDATVSLDIVTFDTMTQAKWFKLGMETILPPSNHRVSCTFEQCPSLLLPYELPRSAIFSCIAMFESGGFDLAPNDLATVMAMSSGDSIFVAAPILCDPGKRCEPHEVRRIVGNIGRAGIAFLIPPSSPRTKKLELESYHMINHDSYDGKLEDCFQSTTLHLGFSGYELAIDVGNHGGRNREAFFLESLIRVHDRGEWVADLDALHALEHATSYIRNDGKKKESRCLHVSNIEGQQSVPATELIAIDRWEELLERPHNAAVLRAHGNWVARLAATVVSAWVGYHTVVVDPDFEGVKCNRCLKDLVGRTDTILII